MTGGGDGGVSEYKTGYNKLETLELRCVYAFVYVSVCVCVSMSVCVCMCACAVCVCVCIGTHVPVYMRVRHQLPAWQKILILSASTLKPQHTYMHTATATSRSC